MARTNNWLSRHFSILGNRKSAIWFFLNKNKTFNPHCNKIYIKKDFNGLKLCPVHLLISCHIKRKDLSIFFHPDLLIRSAFSSLYGRFIILYLSFYTDS